MSSKTLSIFDNTFKTYADALYKYLDNNGIEKVWLAEKITPKGQKLASTQEKISRWKRLGSKPSKETRSIINDILGIQIYQDERGEWGIRSQGVDEREQLETKEAKDLFDRITKYASSNDPKESGSLNRKVLLAFRDQLISQRAQTSSMIQILDTLLEDE